MLAVQILIELLLIFTLLKDRLFFRSVDKYQVLLLAVLIVLTLYQLFFIRESVMFFGNEVRLQGIFLLWHLLILAFLGSKLDLGKLPGILFPLSLIFLLVAALLVESDINGRAIGTLGEANALAASAIFFWPFALVLNVRKKPISQIFKPVILVTVLTVVLLSGSRSALLAFILQAVFFIAVKFIRLRKAIVLVFLLILLSLVLPFLKGGGWYENRSEIWSTAIVAGQRNFLGQGFGNIEHGLLQASLVLDNNLKYQAVDSSHNFLLDFWVQGGAIGLGILLMMILLSINDLIKGKKVIEISVFLGLISVLLFNPASVATLVAFWFMLGQGFRKRIEI